MKAALHRSFTVLLSSLVLFSTVSFTVEKHYCGKLLVGHAVFSAVQKCQSEMHSCGIGEMGHSAMGKKKGCCSDEKERVEGQDELSIYSYSFDLKPQIFIIPLAVLYGELLEEVPLDVIPYHYYEPPQLVVDRQVMDQVFTI